MSRRKVAQRSKFFKKIKKFFKRRLPVSKKKKELRERRFELKAKALKKITCDPGKGIWKPMKRNFGHPSKCIEIQTVKECKAAFDYILTEDKYESGDLHAET